jgi:hypothetical protein
VRARVRVDGVDEMELVLAALWHQRHEDEDAGNHFAGGKRRGMPSHEGSADMQSGTLLARLQGHHIR